MTNTKISIPVEHEGIIVSTSLNYFKFKSFHSTIFLIIFTEIN